MSIEKNDTRQLHIYLQRIYPTTLLRTFTTTYHTTTIENLDSNEYVSSSLVEIWIDFLRENYWLVAMILSIVFTWIFIVVCFSKIRNQLKKYHKLSVTNQKQSMPNKDTKVNHV